MSRMMLGYGLDLTKPEKQRKIKHANDCEED